MTTAEQALERARPSLLDLIRHRENAGHSRMTAYSAVGSALGRSPSWVRKVVGRAPDVVVGLHDWFNITALCERIEAATERNNNEAAWLRGEARAIYETSEGNPELGQVGPSAPRSKAGGVA